MRKSHATAKANTHQGLSLALLLRYFEMDFVRSVMGKSSRIMAFNLRDIVFDWEIQSPEDEARLPLTHRKVFNIIHNFLLDDSETAVDASTALHNLIPPPTSGHAAEYDSDLNMVRDMIFDIACQIPHTNPAQSKLVSLVRRLSRSLGYGVKVQVKVSQTRFHLPSTAGTE